MDSFLQERDALGAVPTPAPLADQLAAGLGFATSASGGARSVLDPACGEGALLLAAWEASGRDAAFASLGLHGIEVDPGRARAARRRLRSTIGGAPGRAAAEHVICADALDPEVGWPEVEAILANPPWSSLSGRRAVPISSSKRELYRATWKSIAGWPSLHGAFLERIARHAARCGARARVLLPASICELDGYGPLRARVTADCGLGSNPLDLGEGVFPGIVARAILLTLEPRAKEGAGDARAWSLSSSEEVRRVERFAEFPRLPPTCFGDPGVHTGNCARELVIREGGLELPGLREGRDLLPYRLGPARARLRIDLAREPGRRFRIASLERYCRATVLVRQTADRPRAALHEVPGYFRNTLLACTPPADLDPAFVVATLNSPAAALFHRLSFSDARQRAFPQVKVKHLRAQPFPLVHRDEDPCLHDEVARLARRARTNADAGRAAEQLVVGAFGVELDR